jgi:hypothetical protein
MLFLMIQAVMQVNKRQLEVQKVQASDEAKTIRELKQVYSKARQDCETKIRELSSRTDMENLQSIVYQKQYQEALKSQLDGIIDTLNSNQFTTISDYLGVSYENGFFGTLYDLQGQGIPLIFPINQEEVVQALQVDSKLSQGLYKRLGEDTTFLKRSIRAELSRGAANGTSWNEIAGHIANGMNSPFNKAYNNALRIARTEGHRVQQEATFHCQQKAKERGADVVKQWDSTLDGATRPDHVELDGQVREIDEPFEVSGHSAPYPGAFGVASEDIHCRCCLLQRARWALSDEEYYEKWNGDKNELVKVQAKTYDEFKTKADNIIKESQNKEHTESYSKIMQEIEDNSVKYREVQKLTTELSDTQIIDRLAGGDMTDGSCSSLAFSYIGNKNGLDVLDFRGGSSREIFSRNGIIQQFLGLDGVKGNIVKVQKEAAGTAEIIKNLEQGKEYYLAAGRHAAIVRRTASGAEYLELQSGFQNGWTSFDKFGSMTDTLVKRFKCRKTVDKIKLASGMSHVFEKTVVTMEVDSFNGNEEFKEILGYINTAVDGQKKGVMGNVK